MRAETVALRDTALAAGCDIGDRIVPTPTPNAVETTGTTASDRANR